MSQTAASQPRLVRVRIEDLVPYEENARDQKTEGFRALVDSIAAFGVVGGAPCAHQPVIVNRHDDFDGTIVGGHRRVEAAVANGHTEIWAIEDEFDADQLAEFNKRLNVPAGDWNWEMLVGVGGEKLLEWGFDDLQLPTLPPDEPLDMDFDFGPHGGELAPTTEQAENEIVSQRMTDVATTQVSAGQNDEAGVPPGGLASTPLPPAPEPEERGGRQLQFFLNEYQYGRVGEILDSFVQEGLAGAENRSEALLAALELAEEAYAELESKT